MAINLGNQNPNALSDINITPLVDVILVLLIIFMVTAPMMKEGIELKLPEATARQFDVESEERFNVAINKDGVVFLDGIRIPVDQLELKLRQVYEKKSEKAVFLEADERLAYGKVVEVMDIIKNAGVLNIGMVTKERVMER